MNVLSRANRAAVDSSKFYPILLLIPASIFVGVALAWSASPLIVGGLLAVVPVLALQVAFIRNLFIGLVAYLIIEYLQPGHRVPVVAYIRPAMLVAGSLLLAWILNMMQHRVKLVLNWQVKSYLIFMILSVGSAATAVSVGMVGKTVITMAKTLIVFTVMFSIVNTLPRLRNLVWTYVLLHLILAVMAFSLFFTTGERNFGDLGGSFLGDENDSAMALLIMVPYAYFMLGETRRPWLRAALIFGIALSSGAVLFSFSRGAFIGFLTMLFYVWMKSTRKARAAVFLAALVAIFFTVMPSEYWERIESVKNYSTEGSAQGRLDAWKGGLQMMTDSPLFGAGLGNFNRTYGTEYNTINTRWTAAHSLYIQFIGELGVPGLIFIVTTIVLTFKTYGRVRRGCRGRSEAEYRTLNAVARGGECGFAGYLVTTFFLNSMAYPHLWHFGAIAGCAVLALEDLKRHDRALAIVEPQETTAST